MILLLGASGYIGHAFKEALQVRGEEFRTLSRSQLDYTRFEALYPFLKDHRPSFIVNAAGYTGKPNVDACETAKADTLLGNTLFPQALAHACAMLDIPWGHVSSGCIFVGCQVATENGWVTEKDMTRPEVRALAKTSPAKLRGFDETMTPNFSFRDPPCSFYSGTKALGEEVIRDVGNNYIWRLRIPFDEIDNQRNYLSKILRYAKTYDNLNSLSHRGDFVTACLDMWLDRVPFGTYNVTNPGFVSTGEVLAMIKAILKPSRDFVFWKDDAEFYRQGAVALRSNCIMDTTKLLAAGIRMRPVHAAIESALSNWQPGA
ncbi:MAG: sugar nucleotide-binding protein [Verrucomicrobia bacterium]|nr:sugar nucleotide-binding protein [Verrucomicrobiota bacterium]